MATIFKGEFARVLGDLDGTLEVTFKTKDHGIVHVLRSLAGEQQIQVVKWKDKRSLDANSYFHVLVSKIAEKRFSGMDEIKKAIVLDYGTPYTDENGEIVIIKIPKAVNIERIYKYAKWYSENTSDKVSCNYYMLMKETHTLNTAEMSRLIEGTIQEAQQLGIETRTPDEIANMMSLWEKGNK